MTLPHTEELKGSCGTIIHWDIEKTDSTNIEEFEIQGHDQVSDVDVLSLDGKSNNGNGGSCQIQTSPGQFIFEKDYFGGSTGVQVYSCVSQYRSPEVFWIT